MSTLKTNNIEHLDATSPSIKPTIGGGVIFAGLSTFQSDANLTTANAKIEWSASSGSNPFIRSIGTGQQEIEFNTGGDERLRIDSSGNLGIGTNNPGSTLHLDSKTTNVPLIVQASENNRARVVFRNNQETGTECTVELINEDLRFNTNSGERMRIVKDGNVGFGLTNPDHRVSIAGSMRVQNPSNTNQFLAITHQGIDFGNTGAGSSSTTASHLLDDYEEGTFTPVLSNDGSTTYTTQVGRYTKVGNIVHINALVRINSVSGGSGVTGFTLPFQNDSGAHAVGLLVGNNSWTSNFSDANLAGWMADGSNEMRFYYNSGQNLEAISVSNIGDSSEAAIQATYRTND